MESNSYPLKWVKTKLYDIFAVIHNLFTYGEPDSKQV
jgi:hypothetical protein